MHRSVPELIAAKRDGHALAAEEIHDLISRYSRGDVPDYQLSSFAMAVFFRGMNEEEMVALTLAMRDSGTVIDLSDVKGRKVDKHSTGGVGDKVSIALAPLVAACGVPVPMVSGRGLGHTGGTLDKLEAIPGFRVDLGIDRFRELVRTIGTAMAGQTKEIAPADKKLYALRDVTGTVESIPLIVASILSKKLAEGIDGLVLDVKVGSGAFMKTHEDARRLAESLVRVTRGAGKDCVALLTRMDRPLGRAVGNAMETAEAFDLLHGRGPEDLRECTFALGAEMLVMGRVAKDLTEARTKLQRVVEDGSAREVARKMVAAQGGDASLVDHPEKLPATRTKHAVAAERDGFIETIDTLGVGLAGIALGAGRTRSEDAIDPAVGFVFEKNVGDRVAKGEPMVWIHSDDAARTKEVTERLRRAIAVGDAAPANVPLVIERVT
jgi:pyrimidine-nucleoside phosphorylase